MKFCLNNGAPKWRVAHVSLRERPFVKIEPRKTENQAFAEFKQFKKANYTVQYTVLHGKAHFCPLIHP